MSADKIAPEAHVRYPHLIGSIQSELSTRMTNEILSSLSRSLLDQLSQAGFEAAGGDIVAGLTSNDFPYLCNYDPDVRDLSHTDQSLIGQCLAFFKKRKDIDLGIDRELAALNKFEDSESACRMTNACFRAWKQGRFQFDPAVERVLHTAQRKISRVLGDAPSWEHIRPRFGPGATTQTPKKNACVVRKIDRPPACTASFASSGEALATVRPLHGEEFGYAEQEIHSAKLNFVDKNAKTKRAICTEPSLNGMFQMGLGDIISGCLLRVGIDLKDQSANQRAALYGSISNASATLDLSSASDTVATGLVEHLLPTDWFDLLSELRSPYATHKKQVFQLEKFSSMGNGFTFPLETLIFWAIAQSTVEYECPDSRIRTLVYGDDIIVDVRAALPVMRVLRAVGFEPNAQKSFWSGTFRESCGKDYVFGTDIRPVFVEDTLTAWDFYRLRNFFHGKGMETISNQLEAMIAPEMRLYGPQGYGDGYLHSSHWIATPVEKNGWGGYTFDVYTRRVKTLRRDIAMKLATPVTFRPKVWKSGRWVSGQQSVTRRVYHARHHFTVRLLATYTQYRRETRCDTLTQSDRLRSAGCHVYRDRRMPDPSTPGTDEDFFVIPEAGTAHRVKVYTFESPLAP